jgi:hypothetical protein
MDPQVVELIGRNQLVTDLLLAGFEVAEPLRDRGIDLIVYLDLDEDVDGFVAVPIQMKVASARSFSINRKYNKFPNLIMAYVWGALDDVETEVYALTQSEAVRVGDAMGYTETASWTDKGLYVTNKPSKRLLGCCSLTGWMLIVGAVRL